MDDIPSCSSDSAVLVLVQKVLTNMMANVGRWRALRNAVHDLTGTSDVNRDVIFLSRVQVKIVEAIHGNSETINQSINCALNR